MDWTIKFDKRALKELEKCDSTMQKRILRFLRKEIAIQNDPRRQGKPLIGKFQGLWRYRVGNYRIICQIKDKELVVFILSAAIKCDFQRPSTGQIAFKKIRA